MKSTLVAGISQNQTELPPCNVLWPLLAGPKPDSCPMNAQVDCLALQGRHAQKNTEALEACVATRPGYYPKLSQDDTC